MSEVSLRGVHDESQARQLPTDDGAAGDRPDPSRAHAHVRAGGVRVGVDHEAGHAERPSAVYGVRQKRRADSAADRHRVVETRPPVLRPAPRRPAGGTPAGRRRARRAIAWLPARKRYTVPIPGSRNADRVAQNIAGADLTLIDAITPRGASADEACAPWVAYCTTPGCDLGPDATPSSAQSNTAQPTSREKAGCARSRVSQCRDLDPPRSGARHRDPALTLGRHDHDARRQDVGPLHAVRMRRGRQDPQASAARPDRFAAVRLRSSAAIRNQCGQERTTSTRDRWWSGW